MSITDRRDGVTQGVAVKRPVRVAATANLTLSGLQTIDGVALGAGDANLRVLAAGQTDATENGIYNASSGVWERAKDFDGAYDIVKGTLIFVTDGAAYGSTVFRVDTGDPIVVGTTGLSIVHYPTLLADDLLAVEALTATGIVRRTGANAWSAGSAVATAEIADDAVTYAKVQNVATDRLLGRDAAGAGTIEELTVAGGLAFTGSGGVTLDIAGLAEDTAPDPAADFVVTRDTSAGANRKVRLDNLLDALPGLVPLAANTTFYVRTDGNDANNGLTNSAGGAFLTWQGGWDKIRTTYNFNGKTVTMQCGGAGAGRTFAPASGDILFINDPWVGEGELLILGDIATPANVILQATNGVPIHIDEHVFGSITVRGFNLRSSNNYGLVNGSHSIVWFGNIQFGDCDTHIGVNRFGARLISIDAFTIAGDAAHCIDCENGEIEIRHVGAISGSRTITNSFARVRDRGRLTSLTGSWNLSGGSVTGKRFDIIEGGSAYVEADGLTHFPGSIAGSVASGGMYIGSTSLLGTDHISFPATQVSSSGPNVLDDYEEGTFTPGLTINGSASGISFAAQQGFYTKIGRVVDIHIRLTLTNNGSNTGGAVITGLPFSVASSTVFAMYIDNTDAARSWMPIGNGATILPRYAGATVTGATDTQITNTSDITISGTYIAA